MGIKSGVSLYGRKETALAFDVLRLISEHYADPDFSLKKVSELLYKNTSSISRIFKEVTGKHFSDYLCSFRMQQAAALLADTSRNRPGTAEREIHAYPV